MGSLERETMMMMTTNVPPPDQAVVVSVARMLPFVCITTESTIPILHTIVTEMTGYCQ